jgi:hypothetical protein
MHLNLNLTLKLAALCTVPLIFTACSGGDLTMHTTDSIAAYVQGTWTTGLKYAEIGNSPIQTIDNSNQSFERTEYAVGAQSEAALLLHAANGRVHESHGVMVRETNQDLRDATHSIAAYVIKIRTMSTNDSKNMAANETFLELLA